MGSLRLGLITAATAIAITGSSPLAQSTADMVLLNGKIITVDERFSIAQAVAIHGDRIVAVGSNAEISKLIGPSTRRIDLHGRAVVPGFIDNHIHLFRAAPTWLEEVRWEGIFSRRQA